MMRKKKGKSKIFAEKAKGKFLSSLCQMAGYILAVTGACMMIAFVLYSLFHETPLDRNFFISAAGAALGCLLVFWGGNKKKFIKRYRYYRNILEGREMISFEEMASITGKKVNVLKKDMKTLIRQGTLLQGHLDEEETCLFLTSEAYDQYVRLGRVKHTKKSVQEEKKGVEKPEAKTLKDLGEEYLLVFENYGKKIGSLEVQKCLSDIGIYSVRILSYERENQQVERFLTYYFPTVEKLLRDYYELEKEAVEADGQDVKDMLGTVRYSFQTFSEKLEEGKGMDVETDILVLETMLSR